MNTNIIDVEFEQIDTNEDITPPVELPRCRAGNRQHAEGVEVAKKDPRDINIGGIVMTATGAETVGEVSKADICGAFALLDQFQRGMNWNCGDLQIIGLKFGEEWVQQQLDTYFPAMSPNTKKQCQWVASRFEKVTRVTSLPWTHYRTVAGIADPTIRQELLESCLPQPGEEDKGPKPASDLRKAVREYRIEKERQKNPLPDDTYRVLYADPPWKYNDERSGLEDYTSAQDHYDTMSISELCELHDAAGRNVAAIAQPDSVLFMWTTSPLLEDAFQVVDAWGFNYKTTFVWDKVRHNFGHYNSVRHELLLLCTKGSCTPDSDELLDSVVKVDRSKIHSQKPDRFYEIIESMYTDGPYLELFARNTRKGWSAWGNEASK